MNTRHEANWQLIKTRKQNLIDKGNARENRKRTEHVYKPGDLVLLKTRGTPSTMIKRTLVRTP